VTSAIVLWSAFVPISETATVLFVRALILVAKGAFYCVMSVWPSVCFHLSARIPVDGFSWNLIWATFTKYV